MAGNSRCRSYLLELLLDFLRERLLSFLPARHWFKRGVKSKASKSTPDLMDSIHSAVFCAMWRFKLITINIQQWTRICFSRQLTTQVLQLRSACLFCPFYLSLFFSFSSHLSCFHCFPADLQMSLAADKGNCPPCSSTHLQWGCQRPRAKQGIVWHCNFKMEKETATNNQREKHSATTHLASK